MDDPADTHRHLSHLVGLYPGYAIASYNPAVQSTAVNYTTDEVLAAATTSLIHRGNGTGPDADSGWEKVWRAACWAQFGNATEFYHELSVSTSIDTRHLTATADPSYPGFVTMTVRPRAKLCP